MFRPRDGTFTAFPGLQSLKAAAEGGLQIHFYHPPGPPILLFTQTFHPASSSSPAPHSSPSPSRPPPHPRHSPSRPSNAPAPTPPSRTRSRPGPARPSRRTAPPASPPRAARAPPPRPGSPPRRRAARRSPWGCCTPRSTRRGARKSPRTLLPSLLAPRPPTWSRPFRGSPRESSTFRPAGSPAGIEERANGLRRGRPRRSRPWGSNRPQSHTTCRWASKQRPLAARCPSKPSPPSPEEPRGVRKPAGATAKLANPPTACHGRGGEGTAGELRMRTDTPLPPHTSSRTSPPPHASAPPPPPPPASPPRGSLPSPTPPAPAAAAGSSSRGGETRAKTAACGGAAAARAAQGRGGSAGGAGGRRRRGAGWRNSGRRA
mmetsp:Transcript_18943/g.50244  ORF Transcript_18943/g.50244 Transcript_18943/m.50244 type:complete len:375 (+) Transcript_18943:213-1337(+)